MGTPGPAPRAAQPTSKETRTARTGRALMAPPFSRDLRACATAEPPCRLQAPAHPARGGARNGKARRASSRLRAHARPAAGVRALAGAVPPILASQLAYPEASRRGEGVSAPTDFSERDQPRVHRHRRSSRGRAGRPDGLPTGSPDGLIATAAGTRVKVRHRGFADQPTRAWLIPKGGSGCLVGSKVTQRYAPERECSSPSVRRLPQRAVVLGLLVRLGG